MYDKRKYSDTQTTIIKKHILRQKHPKKRQNKHYPPTKEVDPLYLRKKR